jgi:SAM-dependent methyltransferase
MTDWDKRYREGFYDGLSDPHELLVRFFPSIPGRLVIDIAMGNGRDAVFLAERGFKVIGLERSWEAIRRARVLSLERGCPILFVFGDAEQLPFREGMADCVVVFYFLSRKILQHLPKMLRKGGLLMYETYLKRQNLLGEKRDPEHLLDDGELFSVFRHMETLFYEEIITRKDGKKKAIARFVGRRL